MAISEFAGTLPRESFRKAQISDRIYQVFSKAVDLKEVGQGRILISYDNEDFSGSPACFATDQVRWEGTGILQTYSKRLIFLAYSLQVSGLFGIDQRPRGGAPTLGELIAGTTRRVFGGLVEWITLQLNRGLSRDDICRLAYGF